MTVLHRRLHASERRILRPWQPPDTKSRTRLFVDATKANCFDAPLPFLKGPHDEIGVARSIAGFVGGISDEEGDLPGRVRHDPETLLGLHTQSDEDERDQRPEPAVHPLPTP